MCSVVSPLST